MSATHATELIDTAKMTKRELTNYVFFLANQFDKVCAKCSRIPDDVYEAHAYCGDTMGFRMEEEVFVVHNMLRAANGALGLLCG